ncbi:MAG TPA: PAS domain S-box protein, partial [Reyranellaceae bacterium]|nr:PAS domain S-box protein [Reyranellaceae bacterium]
LRQSEDRFRGLFMGSPLPKWVYSVQTRRFLEVNHAAIVKYGYSREEFLAMRIEDIRPPEDTARLIARLARGPSPSGQEWRHVLRDGTSIDVEIHSHDVTFADESARLVVALDITARKKAERLTQRLFETSQDVILVTDGYGNFTQASPSTMTALGYTPAELMGRNGADFVAPESIEPVRKAMRLCRAGHALPSFRCNYIHKSGSTVALTWMAVWSEQDRRYFFFGRDMTEHDHTENQLRQSQKMEAVGQLTGGVAHDFNNILAVILANVEDLEEHVPPEFLDRVREIDGATQRAAELIKQLLAFSRKQPLRPQRLSLNDLVSTTGKLLRRTLSENIEISSMLAEHLGPCEVDRAQLESALVNLCINGRDAMPNGGRLTIETANVTLDAAYVVRNPDAVAGDYVMLSVTDTGCGMPPEVAAKVFEPFFTTKGPGKGTGLGLSMVYGLVRQSHGHITVHSTPGQGTTIRIYLPRSEVRPEEDSSVERVPLPQGGESVLLVEDNAVVRTSVSRQLRSLGYNVTEAANADEALGVASRGSFDLLLTDIVMPGSANGRVLAQTLEHTCALTKVVYMSGYSDSAIIHDGRLDEGVLLLSKPFRKPELAQMMRRALDN